MNLVDMKMKLYEQLKSVQLAIKLLVFIIFLGYIMIWIMMPTNVFWLHWLPEINAKVDSTYFGQQGTYILIYTFPILLIAILGCLHLHLDKYLDDSGNRILKDSFFFSWKRPVIVRGPLGIISWTEVSFLLMFVILLVWSFSAYVHGMFKNITRKSATNMGEFVWEVKLDSAALMLGLVGNICLTLLFFPVTRGSSILRLVGLTSEASVKYHIWIGHTVLTLFTAHGLCYIIFWTNTHQISEVLKWDKVGISNVAGEIALITGLAMWVTSLHYVRRKLFELFFYTHHLYIVFIVFYILHVGFSYSCIVLPGFYLFLIDRYLRFLQSQQRIRLISARVLPFQAVELNFAKSSKLDYSPSSIMFVNVKSISKLQWHPFSLTSNCNLDRDRLSVVIKSAGSWSQKLYEKFSSPSPIDHLEVHVEGPYGHPSTTSLLRHEMLVMFSGGSGITPFISIIRELLFMENTTDSKIPRILLVVAFKKSKDITMLDLILPISGTTCDISCFKLKIQAYITRDKNPWTNIQKPPRILCFKPSILDGSVSAVLGQNSWLWLAAIISASFLIFLILLGVLTHYIIRQTDQDSSYYSYPTRSVISMLFLSVSVVFSATVAFTCNKKQNTDARQIQSADTSTPMACPVPDSWQYVAERELESLPQQSFAQNTTVHYGQRPNFEKILLERDESSVGVLVSGPKRMRQDVATICSSGLAKNLQYESFSFDL